MSTEIRSDPHQAQPVFTGGVPLDQAETAVILLHGRGAGAADILNLAGEIGCAQCAYLAPQAAGLTWYPYPFLAPIEQNEPWLTSALNRVDDLIRQLEKASFSGRQIGILGFSQGACLALEYTARHPQRYRAVIGLSGGLIGPPGTPWDYPGSLEATPVFLGCSDVDPHIPLERVNETAEVLSRMDANVTKRIYPGMGHTINFDEINIVRKLLRSDYPE